MTTPPPGQWPPPPSPQGLPPWGPQISNQPKNGATKWILGGLALLVVVVVSVVATLLVTRGGDSAGPPAATGPPATNPADTGSLASANDDGPVEIITEDRTCAAWAPIAETFAAQSSNGWNDRDPSIPASDWTPSQRSQYEAIADAMTSAADQTVALVKLTPHRVMRELYEQSIAYRRAYADAVPSYEPKDDSLARVAISASNAVSNICSAITHGSAASRAPLVSPAPAGYGAGILQDPDNPSRYLTESLSVCSEWLSATKQLDDATAEWFATDPNIPVTEWTPEITAVYERAAPVMQASADELQNLGAQSLNPVFDDFAALSTQYRRAFVQSFPTYAPADTYLANTAAELSATNTHACQAVGAR